MRIRVVSLCFMLVIVVGGCSGEQGSGEEQSNGEEKTRSEETTQPPKGSISANKEVTMEETTTAGETTGGLEAAAQDGEKNSGLKRDKKTGLLLSDTLVAGAEDRTGGPLVDKRLVTFYGHPFSEQMGILGQFEPQEAVSKLKEQAQAYTDADPDRPAICGIELIASVAQPEPGPDGLYLTRTPRSEIEKYARAAKRNDCLLLLDIQIGYSTIADEIEALKPFLKRPYVHLAIDPEYDMDPGEVPGQQFGNSSGEEIMQAAQTLSKIVEEKDLPPKILVIHQFRDDMITNKPAIQPVDNIEMVLHADGFGSPSDKYEKYDLLVRQEPIQYGGFKLFYNQDVPLLTPMQVLSDLNPKPAVISYQ